MGTRGLIRLADAQGKPYATLYSQYDSYPEGIGAKLYKFLRGFKISNGFESNATILYSVRRYNNFLDFLAEGPARNDTLIEAVTVARDKAIQRAERDQYDQSTIKQANGAGCLYAQLVAHLKINIGTIYLELSSPLMNDTNIMLEYVYEIRTGDSGITVQVNDHGELGQVLSLDAFGAYCGVEVDGA